MHYRIGEFARLSGVSIKTHSPGSLPDGVEPGTAPAARPAQTARGTFAGRHAAIVALDRQRARGIGCGARRAHRAQERIRGARELPSVTVASAYCEPDDRDAERVYDALSRWINLHDYKLAGPKREIRVGQILEIQFPVA
jgi:hypothetical protein